MLQAQRLDAKGERYVVGPTGARLTLDDLPPANTQRWVIRRKAEVVAAVRGGLLTMEDACQRYKLTDEEFVGWQQSIEPPRLGGPSHHAYPAVSIAHVVITAAKTR